MRYYAVIDTNVMVSSFLKEGSIPNKIVSMVLNGTITPILNAEIIKEYYEVLLRNNFGLNVDTVLDVLERIDNQSVKLDRTKTEEFFEDKDDVVFYEVVMTARNSNKDAYLVTGNGKHFPNKMFVVTPRQMLEIIQNN